jgi:hypothetical protein
MQDEIPVNNIVLSKDNSYLFAGDSAGRVNVWDPIDGILLQD